MKAIHIVSLLIPLLAVSVAVTLSRRPASAPAPQPVSHPMVVEEEPLMVQEMASPVIQHTNAIVRVEKQQQPVQSLEERGDAMLFEIDAMQNTPFDESVTMPFD